MTAGIAEQFAIDASAVVTENWPRTTFADVILPAKNTLDPRSFPAEEFDYYSIPAYQDGQRPVVERGSAIHSQKIVVNPGTVLFGKLNPRVHKVWRVDGDSGRRKIGSTEFIPLAPQQGKIDSEFLYYLCLTGYVLSAAQELVSGSTPSRQRVDVSAFLKLAIRLPPLAEQRAIARVLRTVHEAKRATEKVLAATRQLKQSLMRHLFTYGPVPFNQADQVELKETDFGAIPAKWSIRKLSETATVQTGVAKGRRINGDDVASLPYLRVANVQDGFLDLREMKLITVRASEVDRYSLRPGDVVLTEGGDFDKLGRGFIWDGQVPHCLHQNHIFAVRADRNLLVPEFLAYQTQSTYGKAYFLSVAHKTTNLACINTNKLKAFPCVVPPKDEQKRIVECLSAVDDKIGAEIQRVLALEALFQTLLHNLMTGRVRVGVGSTKLVRP
jgi:type I restriction enzyme S subunit